jgi:hypothetical protein
VYKKKQGFTFGTLFCGLELLGAAWENDIHVFSIEQMNQRKTTRPKAQSIYQKKGRHLGGVFGSLGQKFLSLPSPRGNIEI